MKPEAEYAAMLDALIESARETIRDVVLQAIEEYEDGQEAQAKESAEDGS